MTNANILLKKTSWGSLLLIRVRNKIVLLHKGNLNFLAEQVNIGEMNSELLLEYSARAPTALFDIFHDFPLFYQGKSRH
jgi:hypothetical protein